MNEVEFDKLVREANAVRIVGTDDVLSDPDDSEPIYDLSLFVIAQWTLQNKQKRRILIEY